MTYVSRTGPYVPNLGNFDTLAELLATHPATLYNPGTTAYTADQGIVVSSGSAWEDVGTGGSFALTAATYAAARLISGVSTGDRLEVLGRTTQSDGGQGLFTWVAGGSTTINDGSQLTAPGGIWQRPDTTIQAQWYGIDPTGVAASDVALNLAIQDAIIQKKKLVLPSGSFLLNAPLLLYPTIPAGHFATIQMEGQGNALAVDFQSTSVFEPNTIFYTNYTNLPALIINCARAPILRNFAILGQNVAPANLAAPSSVSANYVTGGCRDSQYSPYCGICVDPFCTNTPADGGYSGFTYPYGGSLGGGTSSLLVENVTISKFVVGVMVSPSGGVQADEFEFHKIKIYNCRIAYAWGQSQSRENIIVGGSISSVQCAFDTLTYGVVGTAPPPIAVHGTLTGNLYNIINMAALAPCLLEGIYAENFLSIGRFYAGRNPLTVKGCQFSLQNIGGAWLLPCVLLECSPNSAIKFEGCNFNGAAAELDAFNFPGSRQLIFEDCIFSGTSVDGTIPFIACTTQSWSGGWCKLINCGVDNSHGAHFTWISDDTSGRGGNGIGLFSFAGFNVGRFLGTYQTRIVTSASIDYVFTPPPLQGHDITIGNVSVLTKNATTVTFTMTNASQRLVEGDILTWQMIPPFGSGQTYRIPALKIPVGGFSGDNVTANMMFDPAQYDTVANQASATSVNVWAQLWAPTQPLTCTTNTSTSLTAVSPVNCLKPGDFLLGLGVNANDLPTSSPLARVVTTDGAGNVTISKAATGSHTGVGLCFAQLNPQPNNNPFWAGNTGTTPAPNYTNGPIQGWTLSANTTWGVPTNPPAMVGQRLTLLVTANGVWTTAWNAIYRNAPAWAASANAQKATAEFMWDGVSWQFIGGSAAFA